MAVPGSGEFREANEGLLLDADVSARAADLELQVLFADDRRAVLAAVVFGLCEQAERLHPLIAANIDERGYPMTNRGQVLQSIVQAHDMHLRPSRRRFLVTDDLYPSRRNWELLFGRQFEHRDTRSGISMQLTNENADALTGYGGKVVAEDEVVKIRGYTRRLFAEVLNDVDLASEVETFSKML